MASTSSANPPIPSATTPSPSPSFSPRHADPHVAEFARLYGDRLEDGLRSVYRALAEFIDPTTGKGVVTAEVLAYDLDRPAHYVRRKLRDIEDLDGYFTREYVPLADDDGTIRKKHTYEYTYPGLDWQVCPAGDWIPGKVKGHDVAALKAAQRAEAAEAILIEDLGYSPEEAKALVKVKHNELERRKREEGNINVQEMNIDRFTEESEPNPSLSRSINVQKSGVSPPSPEVHEGDEFVDTHWEVISTVPLPGRKEPWHDKGAAKRHFHQHPDHLATWRTHVAQVDTAEAQKLENQMESLARMEAKNALTDAISAARRAAWDRGEKFDRETFVRQYWAQLRDAQ